MTASGPVLVLNAGSSSLKHQLVDPDTAQVLASGLVEQIGESTAHLVHRPADAEPSEARRRFADHTEALAAVMEHYNEHGPHLEESGVRAVGHRVVHGGARFSQPVVIDDEVEAAIDELSELAPLHNPPALQGIRAARALLGELPHVAVFDTAFFTDLPEVARTYAIDRETAQRHGIRRYGFHGTSHRYISEHVAEQLGAVHTRRQIVLHLGNGASASAVLDGAPVDTSMGLTPLEGLVMGTRPGDLDPGLHTHLNRVAGMDVAAIDELLNRHSGLKGLAGVNDFREVCARKDAGDPHAQLAFALAARRLLKYVGSYWAVLGGLDVLTFTAGIGENNAALRAEVVRGLAHWGVELDEAANAAGKPTDGSGMRVISTPASSVRVLVVATNEELAIARDTAAVTRE